MEKKKAFQYLVALSITFALLAVIFFGLGLNKKNTYDNKQESTNVYVNGDAYNFIINGTYFAGYMAISGACLIVAAIMFMGVLKIACSYDNLSEIKEVNFIQRIKSEREISGKLNELKALAEKGIITKSEYEEKKKVIMGESNGK
ncbi:SHOCT domain-containing protein [Lachnoclostridium phytofermentans]|uniref:SHOCT domain-containing protein n=1 Tax=Lachnoclostridium phytofermentans (strain ATCC 700394 / DSM 18823 / ISDg) TaxID=357809 RepID=A9KRT5_LACP7|nr:SHOCT domain-containing protein [Lachnoclostridium phytofermentans]ABX43579.1 hypothetical protein Cphy_3225 [Lachnoclostridium phytofermentans ISDg]